MHGCLRGRHEPPHDGASRDEPSMWTTHLLNQQCNSISGMARLTSRQGHLRRSGSEAIGTYAAAPAVRIEHLAGLKHRMHCNRQFARHGHGSSFEADSLRSFRPHVRSVLSVELRVRMTAAAS